MTYKGPSVRLQVSHQKPGHQKTIGMDKHIHVAKKAESNNWHLCICTKYSLHIFCFSFVLDFSPCLMLLLTYISLITSDVKHLFVCLLVICVSSVEKCWLKSLLITLLTKKINLWIHSGNIWEFFKKLNIISLEPGWCILGNLP